MRWISKPVKTIGNQRKSSEIVELFDDCPCHQCTNKPLRAPCKQFFTRYDFCSWEGEHHHPMETMPQHHDSFYKSILGDLDQMRAFLQSTFLQIVTSTTCGWSPKRRYTPNCKRADPISSSQHQAFEMTSCFTSFWNTSRPPTGALPGGSPTFSTSCGVCPCNPKNPFHSPSHCLSWCTTDKHPGNGSKASMK